MGEYTNQIEAEISAERSELGRNLRVLETKARDLTDWRVHHRNHPGLTMGLAFGGGMLLGFLATSRGHRHVDDDRGTYDAQRERRQLRIPEVVSHTRARAGRQIGETWDRIADALLGVLSARAVSLIGGVVPGFHDHFGAETRRSGPPDYRRDPPAAG